MNEENVNIAQEPDFEVNRGGENPVAAIPERPAELSGHGTADMPGNSEPAHGPASADAAGDAPRKRKINLVTILRGDLLKGIRPHLLFLLFIFMLAVIMVTYRYKVEELTIRTKVLQEEIEELRIRQIQTKCDYMNATMVNEVARKLEPTGIKEGRTPSNKITISK